MASELGSRIPLPQPLDFTARNIAENWRRFKQRFDWFLISEEKDKKGDAVKIALFLQCAGEDAIDLYSTLELSDTATLKDVYTKFEEHCNPQKNITMERFHFNLITQKDAEPFDQFVTRLKQQAKRCEFAGLKDSLIADRIVIGVKNEPLRERLLRRSDLDINKAIELGRAAEFTQKQSAELRAAGTATPERTVDRVTRNGRPSEQDRSAPRVQCKHCGYRHADRSCPAQGKRCRKCGKLNHFAACCKEAPRSASKPVHAVDQDPDDSDIDDYLQFDSIQIDACGLESDDWMQKLRLNGKQVTFKLDTGAQANIVRLCDLKRKTTLKKTNALLKDYNDKTISVKGTCVLCVMWKGREHHLKFFVIDERSRQPILGRAACEQLGLVQRVHSVCTQAEQIFTDYKELFQGLGCLPGKHSIDIDETVPPTACACRKVPFALREPLKQELKRMEKLGVIERVDRPTPWVSAIVIVKKKSGKLRVCIDPRPLNKAIQRQHFQMPTREEMIAQLAGAKYFSKLDAAQGFWQLELDEPSSHLCTFITPFGRYRYKRLPFGISSAPEVYHKTVSQIFDGMDGVSTFADDIIIWGSTREQHEKNLRAVLTRIEGKNLKLNKDKCELFCSELTFIGDRVGADGVKMDPEKIKVVKDMQEPKNKKELQQFLGMVNYLVKWIPMQLRNKDCTSIRQLLLDKNAWVWESHQQEAFDGLKDDLTSAPVLQYFDPNLPVKVSSDASSYGVGFVLLQLNRQEWKPIAYGSRSLTEAEKNWAQIEKEMLAVTIVCEHFHQYVYGRRFCAETDHKPLLGIVKKPLSDCTLRLQRLRLRLQKYDFELVYTPGKHMYVADALSRCKTSNSKCRPIEEDVNLHVAMVQECLPIAEDRLSELYKACDVDHEVRQLVYYITNGWPETRSECELSTHPYWNVRHDLSVANGLVFRGTRVVIPRVLRPKFLTNIHEGHMGIEKCRRRARQAVYWPYLNTDVETMVKSCSECLKYSSSQQREPLMPHDLPTRPFQKLGMDLCSLERKNYLVVVDYFSGYPEVFAMGSDTTAEAVIRVLKQTFARFGIPALLFSDNGPQFKNAQMDAFAREWGFTQMTSSPYHPKSNGMAEAAVKAIKQLLKKTKESNQDLYKGLLAYRNTPQNASLKSPAQLLMGRRLSEPLLVHPSAMTDDDNDAEINAKLAEQERQQQTYNRQSRALSELPLGAPVRIQHHTEKDWGTKAVVTNQVGPRSYELTTSDGAVLRRNRVQLKDSAACDVSPSPLPLPPPPSEAVANKPLETAGPPPTMEATASAESSVEAPVRQSSRVRKQPDRFGYESHP